MKLNEKHNATKSPEKYEEWQIYLEDNASLEAEVLLLNVESYITWVIKVINFKCLEEQSRISNMAVLIKFKRNF